MPALKTPELKKQYKKHFATAFGGVKKKKKTPPLKQNYASLGKPDIHP